MLWATPNLADLAKRFSNKALAIHLLASGKPGMSAHQIHRNLGISHKAASLMMHRLRYAMRSGPLPDLMTGTVAAWVKGWRRMAS